MAELHDFGEKIGGARKDLWRTRGLILSDLDEMTVTERSDLIKKDNIWTKPDWQQQIADGKPQALAYWQNKMRQSIPPKPHSDDEVTQNHYVQVVGAIRDAVMAVDEPRKIDTFYQDFFCPNFITSDRGYRVAVDPIAEGIINNKVLKAAQSRHGRMKSEAEKKLFGIPKDEQAYVTAKNNLAVYQYDGKDVSLAPSNDTDKWNVLTISTLFSRSYYYLQTNSEFHDISKWEQGKYFVVDTARRCPIKINFETEKDARDFIESYARSLQDKANEKPKDQNKSTGAKRKKPFVPRQLQHIKRTGPNYRHLRHADGDLFMEDLKFRAGEFGNWLNQDDRQMSLDMAYDGLRDMARLLHIHPDDISLGGSLAIAFGSRGVGGSGASAHYEPGRQVINLTKMTGAGCLAHEWAHALDHAIGLSCGLSGMASEKMNRNVPEVFSDLISAMKYKTVTVGAEAIAAEAAPKVEYTKKQLLAWVDSMKPSDLPANLTQAWDKAAQQLIASAHTFVGIEYMSSGPRDKRMTNPEIEMLSQIRKSATNHSIPRDTKRQMAMWAFELKNKQKELGAGKPQERRVKTDFYEGSIVFDSLHTRAGHGYWQSDCEMFARAFDCYISDKIKADGNRSDYLSARADSFITTGSDGKPAAAIPQGEERAVLNEKFDLLIDALKERGILHDHTEVLEEEKQAPESAVMEDIPYTAEELANSEQLSFDDLLFSAQQRVDTPNSLGSKISKVR